MHKLFQYDSWNIKQSSRSLAHMQKNVFQKWFCAFFMMFELRHFFFVGANRTHKKKVSKRETRNSFRFVQGETHENYIRHSLELWRTESRAAHSGEISSSFEALSGFLNSFAERTFAVSNWCRDGRAPVGQIQKASLLNVSLAKPCRQAEEKKVFMRHFFFSGCGGDEGGSLGDYETTMSSLSRNVKKSSCWHH